MFDIAEISNFSEREILDYEAGMKCDDVYDATIAYAKRIGTEEGIAKGIKQGVVQGVKRGIKRGVVRGYNKGTTRVLKLMDQGYSSAEIKRMLSKKS